MEERNTNNHVASIEEYLVVIIFLLCILVGGGITFYRCYMDTYGHTVVSEHKFVKPNGAYLVVEGKDVTNGLDGKYKIIQIKDNSYVVVDTKQPKIVYVWKCYEAAFMSNDPPLKYAMLQWKRNDPKFKEYVEKHGNVLVK